MAYRILSVFHPDNDISQVFQNHAFRNAKLKINNKNYLQFLRSPELHCQKKEEGNQKWNANLSFIQTCFGYQYQALPFQYKLGLDYSLGGEKIKLGIDFLTDDYFTADQSITSLDAETSKEYQAISLSRTILWDDWKFGYQTKYFPKYQSSITDFRWQTSPLQGYTIISNRIPFGYWIINNWQYRGEVKNLEGMTKDAKLPTILNNSVVYQPEEWLILHLGLSTILPTNGIDLIIGSSVNLSPEVNISYQYQNQNSVFDLYLNQVGITYHVNHGNNSDSWGVKYSLQY